MINLTFIFCGAVAIVHTFPKGREDQNNNIGMFNFGQTVSIKMIKITIGNYLLIPMAIKDGQDQTENKYLNFYHCLHK